MEIEHAEGGPDSDGPGDLHIITKHQRREGGGIPRKLVVVIVVIIVLGSAGLFIWFEYLRPWSLEEVASQVINDPTEGSPGFKHSLAGRTVTVKGEVTNITIHKTTLGPLTLIQLDNFELLHLVVWGNVPYEVGRTISMDVEFEWSVCNDEEHVYSPQLDFPAIATLPSIGIVLQAVAVVGGSVITMSDGYAEDLTLTVFDQYPALSLADLNVSLRAGRHSFTLEYVEVLGIGLSEITYGRDVDSITNLATGTSMNGKISFNDSDHDSLLDRNDTFTLSNLSRPTQGSGVYTYALILVSKDPPVGRTVPATAVFYIVMTNRGALTYVDYETPFVRIESEVISPMEVQTSFARVMNELSWNDVKLFLADGFVSTGDWYPASGDLDNGPMSEELLPSITVGSLSAICKVVDVAGNGLVDEGDYFTVSTWGSTSFSPDTNYTIGVVHEPTMNWIAHNEFHG